MLTTWMRRGSTAWAWIWQAGSIRPARSVRKRSSNSRASALPFARRPAVRTHPATPRREPPAIGGPDAAYSALRGRLANLPAATAQERHLLREVLLKELGAAYMPLRALAAEGLG